MRGGEGTATPEVEERAVKNQDGGKPVERRVGIVHGMCVENGSDSFVEPPISCLRSPF